MGRRLLSTGFLKNLNENLGIAFYYGGSKYADVSGPSEVGSLKMYISNNENTRKEILAKSNGKARLYFAGLERNWWRRSVLLNIVGNFSVAERRMDVITPMNNNKRQNV